MCFSGAEWHCQGATDNKGWIRKAESKPEKKTTKEEEQRKENNAMQLNLKAFISQIMVSLFTPTSPQRSKGAEEPFPPQSPKYLNKRHQVVEECTKCEESAAERRGNPREEERGVGGVIKKALDEACTSRLCLSSFVFFFNISYVCIFLPTEERVNKRTGSKVSA